MSTHIYIKMKKLIRELESVPLAKESDILGLKTVVTEINIKSYSDFFVL